MERLGSYSVERKLADGGMGTVYLGRSAQGQPAVLKVPHAQDRESSLALADEARAGMRLRHRAVVETLDFFVDRGVSVLVVAFIEGANLFEMRRRVGPLPAAAVAEIGAEIASALDAIHGAVDDDGRALSMIHRDVTPNNVLIGVDGQARLIDLGIVRSAERTAKATMQGMVKGTLRYLAPEILGGADHSASTDLWALGLTLLEAALGRYALLGDELDTVRAAMDGSIMARLRAQKVNGYDVDAALLDAVNALVSPPESRLRNARAAAAVLARLASKLTGGREWLVSALTQPPPPRLSAPVPLEVTELTSRPSPLDSSVEATAATVLKSRTDVDSVFTSHASRESLVSTAPAPVDDAPTIAMAAWSATEELAPPHGKSAPDLETAPTIQMGAWQPPPTPEPATVKGPAPSLFLPIVVVDEDGEEIG